jgi:SAM-dependent methyltransferase
MELVSAESFVLLPGWDQWENRELLLSAQMIDLTAITRNLEPTVEKIWRSKSASGISYPEWGNELCFAVEDSSFWFRHRNACICEAVKRFPPSGAVFDIGGGNGFVARGIQELGFEVVLLEPGPLGSRNAKLRGIQNVVCASLEDARFLPATIGAAGLFDVIEHIENDREFLQSVCNYLVPAGRVYITVPAYQALWSHEDIDAGHFRRYSWRALHDVLEGAGFEVELLTGFFQFLPPAILAGRVLPYRLGLARQGSHVESKMRSEHQVGSDLVQTILSYFEGRELAQIRTGRQVKFGASWLAVAKQK